MIKDYQPSVCRKQAAIFVTARSYGFTMIELMIVVAIISILAVISIPIYQTYSARAQFSEAMTLAAGIKQRISEVKTFQGQVPTGNGQTVNSRMGLPAPADISGEYVSAVEVLNENTAPVDINKDDANNFPDGTILVEYKTLSAFGSNRFAAISPTFLVGAIKWDCKSDTSKSQHIPAQFRPPVCRP